MYENLQPSVDLFSIGSDFIYQQDNAPCHTANSVKDYFEDNGINVLPWPTRSPNLNTIENLCVSIDRKLQSKSITNKGQLRDGINEAWSQIPAELCQKLIESMPRRIAACIKAKGGHIKY